MIIYHCTRAIIILFLTVLLSLFIRCDPGVTGGEDIDKNIHNINEKGYAPPVSVDGLEDIKKIDKKITIYDGKFKMGWIMRTWNGLTASEIPYKDSNLIKIVVSKETRPWSGIKIKSFMGINIISLDKEMIEKGEFVFYVNGGEDIFGNHIGGQHILLSLEHNSEVKAFLRLTGEKTISKIHVQGKYIVGNSIDSNPDTWQRVSVPIKEFPMLNNFTDKLDSIFIQFDGAPPKNGIAIKNMYIGLATYDQKTGINNTVAKTVNSSGHIDKISFPELTEIAPDIIMPAGNTVSVDEYGNFIVNGKPRYLIGVHTTAALPLLSKPGTDNDDELGWIYKRIPDYNSSQRLGLDTFALFTPPTWTSRYLPTNRMGRIEENANILAKFIRNIKLPLYVDLACTISGHGLLAFTSHIPEEAKSDERKSHYLFYSITHPEGIKFYTEYWQSSAKLVLKSGGYPFIYELFNEPGFNDDDKYTRKLFIKFLKDKYKDISELNKIWHSNYPSYEKIALFKKRKDNPGLFIDYGKFLEYEFTKLSELGVRAIKEADPRKDIRIGFQPGGRDMYRIFPRSNVNTYEANKYMNVIITGTGGGINANEGLLKPVQNSIDSVIGTRMFEEGILMANYFRNIAGDKPVLDGEFTGSGGPFGRTDRITLRNDIWLEAVRGYSATYLFKWHSESLLNPDKVPTDALLAVMDFRNELEVVEDLLVTRPRNVKRDIALLMSYPTVRMSQATGGTTYNDILSYTGALEFSHWPYDVILEEQFPDKLLKNYKVLIAAGINYIYPQSVMYIDKFIREGGTLIIGGDIPGFDEYGNRLNWVGTAGLTLKNRDNEEVGIVDLTYGNWKFLPGNIKGIAHGNVSADQEWETVGSIGDRHLVFKKDYGKGGIYYIGIKMPEYSLASVLGSIFVKEKVRGQVELTHYKRGDLCPNIEIHSANRNDKSAFFLYNWDSYSKLAFLNPVEWEGKKYKAFDLISKEEYSVTEKGTLVYLPPHDRKIIVISKEELKGITTVFVNDEDLIIRYENKRNTETVR